MRSIARVALFSLFFLGVSVAHAQRISVPVAPIGLTGQCFCPVSGSSTSYSYWVIAKFPFGQSGVSNISTVATYALGPSRPVLLNWNSVPGATSYDILRQTTTTTPVAGTATNGIVTGVTTNSFTDTGLTAVAYTMPSSGAVAVAADTATLTVAQALASLLTATPTAAAALTTPTATALVAAMPNCIANVVAYTVTVKNTSAGANTITWTGGTTVTVTGTATIAQNAAKTFLVVPTSCTTPAVTYFSLGSVTF